MLGSTLSKLSDRAIGAVTPLGHVDATFSMVDSARPFGASVDLDKPELVL